jgi:hypothetical protein
MLVGADRRVVVADRGIEGGVAPAHEAQHVTVVHDPEQATAGCHDEGHRGLQVAHRAQGSPRSGRRRDDRARCLHDVPGGEHASAIDVLHELGDVVVGRVREDLLGRAELHDAAVAHDGDAIAEEHRLVQVVGDEDDRLAQFLLQLDELHLHLAADERIECGEGLVHEQDVGIGGECAGETHPLLHPARELGRELVGPPRESHPLEHGGGSCSALRGGNALELERVGGVVEHGAVGKEREVLEDHRDAFTAHGAQPLRRDVGDALPHHGHLPARGLEQAVEHADEGGLA